LDFSIYSTPGQNLASAKLNTVSRRMFVRDISWRTSLPAFG